MAFTKFNIQKHKQELEAIAKANNIESQSAVTVIINEMEVYNQTIEDEKVSRLVLFQISSSIFKKLKDFQLVPTLKKTEIENEDELTKIMKNVRKR